MESRIAMPGYLAGLVQAGELPPGHAFFMYFRGTMTPEEAAARSERRRRDKEFKKTHDERKPWLFDAEGKRDGLKEVIDAARKAGGALADQIAARQSELASECGAERFAFQLTSALTTGTGIEHPLENGFSFLWPYGIPYLPGSAIKGTLRRAAEMLATGEANGLVAEAQKRPKWTWPAIWWLFGFDSTSKQMSPEGDDALLEAWLKRGAAEGNSQLSVAEFKAKLREPKLQRTIHARGALEFWDCFPKGDMKVDIMNPHARSYYQGGGGPAECENPVPIYFLTVAPGATMKFHVRAADEWLPQGLDWPPLLRSAFALAADWLGFGAKTAVGYGALQRDAQDERRRQQEAAEKTKALADKRARDNEDRKQREAEAAEQRRLAAMNPIERRLEELARGKETDGARVAAWVSALPNWPEKERCAAAREVRAQMQAMKLWREDGNPDRDKVAKRTQAVLQVLAKCEAK